MIFRFYSPKVNSRPKQIDIFFFDFLRIATKYIPNITLPLYYNYSRSKPYCKNCLCTNVNSFEEGLLCTKCYSTQDLYNELDFGFENRIFHRCKPQKYLNKKKDDGILCLQKT